MKEVNIEEFDKSVKKIIAKPLRIKPKKDLDYVLAKMKLYKAFLEIKKEEILSL